MVRWLRPHSNAGSQGSVPGEEAKIPHAFWPKRQTQNRSNTVTNSIKALKMFLIKKN